MGFCKPGDNCFNQKVLKYNNKYLPKNIVQQINRAITGDTLTKTEMEACGVIVPNFCPDVVACMSGHTGHGTGYWIMNGSGDIYNTGTTSSFVGVGTDAPANQLHVVSTVMTNPIRVERLVAREDNYVTVDTNGVFYVSENTSDVIDGGDF
jgi:hypothetical protein